MASYTTNLNLVKPTINDPFNVEDANSNMQKVDDAYGKVVTLTGTTAPTTSTAGAVGQFYLNTTTSILYQCANVNGSVYTWNKNSVTIYTGTTSPSSSTGTDGDIYMKKIY